MSHSFTTSEKLLDREKQRQEIAEALQSLQSTAPRFHGLEFYGLAGIGKSRILDVAKSQCRERALAFAVVDFLSPGREPQAECLSVLVRLCDQLDQHFSVQRLRQKLTATLQQQGTESLPEATRTFRLELGAILNERPLVLMFDSVELCTDDLFNWLGRELIWPLAKEHGDLALILGSRGSKVRENRWPAALKAQIKSFRLDPLDFQATEQHVFELPAGDVYHSASEHIYDLSIGHPYSSEALVSWLREMKVPVDKVEMGRRDLAQRLYEEVIRHYVLAQADEWVLPMLEVASIPRWFDAALLGALVSEFRPDVGGAQPIQYYVARISDLMAMHLMELCEGQMGYQEQPTLRQLLNAVLIVLRPDEMTALHEQAIQIRHVALQREVEYKAFYALELIYHLVQKALIESPETLDELLSGQLDVILQAHFMTAEEIDTVRLTQLLHRLRKDRELCALVPDSIVETLETRIEHYLHLTTPQHKVTYLILDHFPPTEYRISWYRAGQSALPTESVHTSISFSSSEWRSDPRGTGETAYRVYLPNRTQEQLRAQQDGAIQLHTDWADIPWELLHDGNDFLCLKCPLARKPKLLREPRDSMVEESDRFQALVVGDPTYDLNGAEEEAREVAAMLGQSGGTIDLLLGDQATPEVFSKLVVKNPYRLIHFAGHGYFDAAEPRKSGLVFAGNRVVCGEELERVLSGRPFVFLSACEAGMESTVPSRAGFWGNFTEGIAISTLLGGALGCLGPMWPIKDGIAKGFAIEFYVHFLRDMPIGEAVRRARMWAKEQDDHDFWAAWVLYGDPLQRYFD
jgi:hypothetical protein